MIGWPKGARSRPCRLDMLHMGKLRGVALSVFFVASSVLWLAFVLVPSYALRGLSRGLHRRLISLVFGSFWTVRPALAITATGSLK